MTADAIKLLRYRYGRGTAPYAMQDGLHSVSVVKDISGKEDIHISMLGSFEEPQASFTPGDFIALQDQTSTTWSWGRVSVVRSTMKREVGGNLTHAPYAVMVQGWYDFLTRSKIHVAVTTNRPSVGTLFNLKDWLAITSEMTKMYGLPAGTILQYMLRQMLRIKLPESLGGGWFADEIPVVYDRETALRYAPEFEDIEPVQFGNLLPQLSAAMMNVRSSDVGSLIAEMFLFENSIVELIPYLSTQYGRVLVPTDETPPPPGAAPTSPRFVGQRTKLGDILGAQPVLVYRIKPFRTEPLYRAAVSKVHYLPEDAEQGYLDKELALYDEDSRSRLLANRAIARKKTTEILFDDKMFSQITFNPETITPLPYSYITSVSRQRNDAERLNASTINAVPSATPGGTSPTSIDWVGLPIQIDNQIENHGLRLRVARWNMYPEGGAVSTADIAIYYRIVAAQVMQFYEKSHLYETGNMSLHFAHTQYFVESDTRQQSTYDKAVLDLEPGRWFRTSFVGMDTVTAPTAEPRSPPTPEQVQYGPPVGAASNEYYGYITSVSHNIQRLPNGALTAGTQISFIRGHFADMWDLVNGVNVPLNPIESQPGNGTGGQSAGGGRACGLRSAEIAGVLDPVVCGTYALFRPLANSFAQGLPTTDWNRAPLVGGLPGQANNNPRAPVVPPVMTDLFSRYTTSNNRAPSLDRTEYNRLSTKYVPYAPPWLLCWFYEAISVMPMNEYKEIRAYMRNANPRPPQDTNIKNLHAIAACAFVIESYWRSRPGYQDVRLRIRSIPRAKEGGYHKLYAAMDFYLEYPADFTGEQAGALQVWASLFRLAEARRIPYGGRGLYLNVNPDTGIKGTAPSQAGEPSKTTCQYPPGGSSWTHYDIRAMWGITTRNGGLAPAFFTSWVATDWNGDGKDEISLSDSFAPPNVATQNGGVEDTANYVWANVADPDFTYLEEYISDPIKSAAAPGVSAIMAARKERTDRKAQEEARVPVRDALRHYFNSNGLNDTWMHAVTASVPNMYQVFDLERYVGQLLPVGRVVEPTKSTPAGDLYLAKLADGTVQNAPLVVVFGGVNVAGQPSGVYMYNYAKRLMASNHVVIAASDRVDYDAVAALSAEAIPHTTGKPRTLYIFSNGVLPTHKWIQRYAGATPIPDYSAIYMVDAYLGSNTQRARAITVDFTRDMGLRAPNYYFFYTNATSENGMTQATRDAIIGGGTTPAGIAGMYKENVTKGLATTDLEWHMRANDVAMSHLYASALTD